MGYKRRSWLAPRRASLPSKGLGHGSGLQPCGNGLLRVIAGHGPPSSGARNVCCVDGRGRYCHHHVTRGPMRFRPRHSSVPASQSTESHDDEGSLPLQSLQGGAAGGSGEVRTRYRPPAGPRWGHISYLRLLVRPCGPPPPSPRTPRIPLLFMSPYLHI